MMDRPSLSCIAAMSLLDRPIEIARFRLRGFVREG